MPRALAEEIANDLWIRSDGQGEVMLSGQNTGYLMERGVGMLKRIQFIGTTIRSSMTLPRCRRRSQKYRCICTRAWGPIQNGLSHGGKRRTVR